MYKPPIRTPPLLSKNLQELDPVGSTVRSLRDDEAVHWVSIGQYEAVAVGN